GDTYSRRPLGPVARAVSAVGARSMTCYVAQSVLCAPVLAAWGLGLGAHLSSVTIAVYAVVVWLVTLAYAVVAEHAGRAGPLEALMRRLAYRDRGPGTAPGGHCGVPRALVIAWTPCRRLPPRSPTHPRSPDHGTVRGD